jgi:hypothetical protein
MGNLNIPELKTFGKIARTLSWAGAIGGAWGGYALTTAHVAGAIGVAAGIGAGAFGLVLGTAAGFGIAIPVGIAALIGRDIIRRKLGFNKPQPAPAPQATVAPAPPVAQVVKESLSDVKTIAKEFNAEAAVQLADDITFRTLKLSVKPRPENAPKV